MQYSCKYMSRVYSRMERMKRPRLSGALGPAALCFHTQVTGGLSGKEVQAIRVGQSALEPCVSSKALRFCPFRNLPSGKPSETSKSPLKTCSYLWTRPRTGPRTETERAPTVLKVVFHKRGPETLIYQSIKLNRHPKRLWVLRSWEVPQSTPPEAVDMGGVTCSNSIGIVSVEQVKKWRWKQRKR